MNKRGNIFFGVTIGIVCFIMGVLIIPFLADNITVMRTDLNCTGVGTISDGVKFTCLLTDLTIPYWIWFFCSLAIGILMGMNK